MLDIETLSTKQNALVLSVGAVWFSVDGTQTVLDVALDPVGQPDRHIDPDTVRWWMGQNAHARKLLATPADKYTPLPNIADILTAALADADEVWANDPDFDCTILRDLFPDIQWPFWKFRSVRTIKALAGKEFLSSIPESGFIAHNALADAMEQARVVTCILTKIRVEPLRND
jgi:hypothetical protein